MYNILYIIYYILYIIYYILCIILESIRGQRRGLSSCGIVVAIRLGVGAVVAPACCSVVGSIRLAAGA